MPRPIESFLARRTVVTRKAALGRVARVTRETWRLSDDPERTPPETEVMATGKTASEAADLARQLALAFPRHGFHKPSASWWGACDTWFHRFVVHAGGRRRGARVLIASGLMGVALAVAFGRRRRPRPAYGPKGPTPKGA